MVREAQPGDAIWASLVELPEEERRGRMTETYGELASLAEPDRKARMLAMARAEYALSDERLRTFTLSRLRVWLSLPAETARIMAATYDAAMAQMPARAAMRHVELVQTLARTFSSGDEAKLRQLVPAVFGGVARESQPAAAVAQPQPPRRKGFWPFRRS